MTSVQNTPNPMANISTQMGKAASDGRITSQEAKDLNKWIEKSDLQPNEKKALSKMIGKLEDSTNGQFLFFKWKSKISASEMGELKQLTGTNKLASGLLDKFNQARHQPGKVSPPKDQTKFNSAASSQASFGPSSGVSFNTGSSVSSPGNTQANQFINPDGSRSATGRADCGPSCAYMILGDQGITPNVNKYTDMRSVLGSDRRGASAVSKDDIAKMLSEFSNGQVTRAAADKPFPKGQSASMVQYMKEQLSAGNSVIMLNGGFGGTAGHYTVVDTVNDDGSVTFKDPGSGQKRTVSPAQLEEMMKARAAAGRGAAYVQSFN